MRSPPGPGEKRRSRTFAVPEHESSVEDELRELLSEEEYKWTLRKKNRATALLALQSSDLERCVRDGLLTEYRQVELGRLICLMYEHQGKSERIKNFPYPRQFATLNLYFIWLFVLILPFGVVREFQEVGGLWVWMSVPVTVVVAWVFHTMDKIGEASENPFEAGPNDVPITALARTIEIDMRDIADEDELPEPLSPIRHILM